MSPSQKNTSSSGKPKRVRRKCTAPGCENRVVQGGVCVTHGAKRKLCTHPGCSKAVKAAGLCSTHGPSRKKCTYVDPSSGSPCYRVAVQGGRCLSHGARRRFCSFPGKEVCTKNAVSGGYCKKHHDMVEDANGILDFQSSPSNKSVSDSNIKNTTAFCAPVGSIPGGSLISGASSSFVSDHSSVASSPVATDMVGGGAVLGQPQLSPLSMQYNEHFNKSSAPLNNKNPTPKKKPPTAMRVSKFPSIYSKPNHKRGMSIFDEMPVVDAIIGAGGEQREPAVPSSGAGVAKQQQFDVLVGTSTGNVVHYSGVQKKAKLEQPHPPKQRQLPADSTKTPQTQVTFADSVRNNSQEAPLTAKPTDQNPEDVCLQNSSCTCSACRSPTLAIFDQMLQASQKIDQGETKDERYAGLSPPKLGHSKTSAATSEHNKSVKEEKTYDVLVGTSTGNVVRFSGEARNVSDNSLEASSQNSPSKERAGAVPASSALTAAVKTAARDDNGGGNGGSCVNRTVSQDADSPRSRSYNYYGYGYPPPHPHPSHYYYPHHHPHPYYYQYHPPPHPHHPYPQHPPPPPNQAPGTPILNNEDAAVTSQLSSREKRKQQKRLLPKPRGKSLDCLFPASKELLP